MQESISEAERQQLAADAHRAARAIGLKQIMAASNNGGVTRANLIQSNPLAVKVRPLSSPNLTMAMITLWCNTNHRGAASPEAPLRERLTFANAIEQLTAAILMNDLWESWTLTMGPYRTKSHEGFAMCSC